MMRIEVIQEDINKALKWQRTVPIGQRTPQSYCEHCPIANALRRMGHETKAGVGHMFRIKGGGLWQLSEKGVSWMLAFDRAAAVDPISIDAREVTQ